MAARTGERAAVPPEPLDDGDLEESLPPVKKEKPPKPKKTKGAKKGRGGIIAIIVVVLLLGAVAAVIALDLFGIREEYIMPYVRNAPLIGNLFPEPEVDPLGELTPEQWRARYNTSTQQVESLQNQLAQMQEQLADANLQILDLRRFYVHWQQYREARAAFDQMLAHEAPYDFVEFFGDVAMENIPQLYLEAQQIIAFENEVRSFVRILNNMDESGAGEVLEQLMMRDTALMLRILHAISDARLGEIFDTLEDTVVATMIILMSSPEPTFAPLVPPYLPMPPPIEAPPAPTPTVTEPPEADDEPGAEPEAAETEPEAD